MSFLDELKAFFGSSKNVDIKSVIYEEEAVANTERKFGEIAVGEKRCIARFVRKNGDDLLVVFLQSDIVAARKSALREAGQAGEVEIKDIFEGIG